MAPAIHTAKDEAAFMADLLGGLDDSRCFPVPTTDPSPVGYRVPHGCKTPSKPRIRKPATMAHPQVTASVPPPCKVLSADDINMAELLQGAEDWDWDDDLLTPKESLRKVTQVTSSTPKSYAQIVNR